MTPLRWITGLVGALACTSAIAAEHFTTSPQAALKFGVHEVVLEGDGSVPNPFDTVVQVRFTPPSGASRARTVWAFHDGGNTWRARVYPSETGEWSWSSTCETDPGLSGKSGRFQCVESELPGRLLVHPKNPRQWMTEDGRWFLNLNDTSYFLLCAQDSTGAAIPDADARAYVKDAMERGITSFRSFIAVGTGASRDLETDHWNDYFEDRDRTRPNRNSIGVADRRLRMLLDEFSDATIQVVLFPRGSSYRADDTVWSKMSTAQRERILRYLIARFGAYPQIFWLVVNDAHYAPVVLPPRAGDPEQPPRTLTFPSNIAMAREVGAFFQNHDPWRHPISTGPARGVPFYFEREPWTTYIHLEAEFEVSASRFEDYQDAGKPVFLGEDRYEQDIGPSRDPKHMRYFQRRLFWSWLLGGGSANYGGRWWALQPYSQTGDRHAVRVRSQGKPYTDALVGLDSVKYIRDYFETRKIDLSDFEPDHARVSDPGIAKAVDAPRLMRRGTDEFLAYHPNAIGERRDMRVDADRAAQFRLDLKDATGAFQADWYRPMDGISQDGGLVEGGKVVEVTSPWVGHDVVLRLRQAR